MTLCEAWTREDAEKIAAIFAEVGFPKQWPCRVYVEPLHEQHPERITTVVYRTWTREDTILPESDGRA